MALNREQRRALLKSELDGDAAEVVNVDTVDPSPVVETPAPVASPAVALTQDQFAALLAAIGNGNGNIGSQIAEAIQANRQPIPENTPDQYHARSVYHLAGKDEPVIPLKSDMWLGVWDHEQGKAIPAYELHSSLLTDAERAALNTLTPGRAEVTLTDGSTTPARIVAQEDDLGNLSRMVIAFPRSFYGKDSRNTLPPYVQLVGQLTTA